MLLEKWLLYDVLDDDDDEILSRRGENCGDYSGTVEVKCKNWPSSSTWRNSHPLGLLIIAF